MRFDPESNPENFVSGFGVEKIPSNADLSNFLRTIPEITSAIALNNSFRIVMPAGVVGIDFPINIQTIFHKESAYHIAA